MAKREKQMFVCLACEIGSQHERGSKQSCPHCGNGMEPLEPINTEAELKAAIKDSEARAAQEN